jgi:hypothetical protein
MGIGISIFLIAVGAILTFAVDAVADGVNLDTVGIILMVVGLLGLLASMTIFGSWGDRGGDHVVVEERRL